MHGRHRERTSLPALLLPFLFTDGITLLCSNYNMPRPLCNPHAAYRARSHLGLFALPFRFVVFSGFIRRVNGLINVAGLAQCTKRARHAHRGCRPANRFFGRLFARYLHLRLDLCAADFFCNTNSSCSFGPRRPFHAYVCAFLIIFTMIAFIRAHRCTESSRIAFLTSATGIFVWCPVQLDVFFSRSSDVRVPFGTPS